MFFFLCSSRRRNALDRGKLGRLQLRAPNKHARRMRRNHPIRRIERFVSTAKVAAELAKVAVSAAAAVFLAFRTARRRAGGCCVRFESHRQVDAVLYYLRTEKKVDARWTDAAMGSVMCGNHPVLVPCGSLPVRVPGDDVSVRMIVATSTHAIHGGHQATSTSTSMEVHARSPDVAERFVAKAAAAYAKAQDAHRDVPKHYKMVVDRSSGGRHPGKPDISFDEFDMPTQTFDNVILPESKNIRDIVRRFDGSEARSAVLGRRHHLNLMLHGVPGGGKSSAGPAVANDLGRSLVTMQLSMLQTVDEFVWALRMLDDTIDIGSAVIAIDDADTTPWMTQQRPTSFAPSSFGGGGSCSSSGSPASPASLGASSSDDDEEDDDEEAAVVVVRKQQTQQKEQKQQQMTLELVERNERRDRENNFGTLLNELDGTGCSRSHGRIIVMNTNRIEEFDPALMRPGRMRKIEIGPLDAACVARYHALYFDGAELPAEARSAVERNPPTLGQLSELLSSFDADEVVRGLVARG